MGLLGSIMMVGLLAATGTIPDFATRVDRAIVTGDEPALEALRTELLAAINGQDSPTADLRHQAAYAIWRLSHLVGRHDKGRMKDLLSEAQAQLDLLLEETPDDEEALALRGSAIGGRITGTFSGIWLGPEADRSLGRAAELAPDNPRIALLTGIKHRFTPSVAGGGLEHAEETLRRSLALFQKEEARDAWPHWGRVDAQIWMGVVLAAQGKVAEARSFYDQALALEPDHAWLREELIPALDKPPR